MRKNILQQRLPSPDTQSSAKPMGSLLTRIFHSPSEENRISKSPAVVSEKASSAKSRQGFVPFVNERNSMNRLILPFASPDEIKEKENPDSWRNFKTQSYKAWIKYTVKVSKKNKFHLTNILNLDDNFGEIATPISPKSREVESIQTEGNEANLRNGFKKFKVNWQAYQKPAVSARKASSPFFSLRTDNSEDSGFIKKSKPQAVFLSTSRDKLEVIRSKTSLGVPDIGIYETENIDSIKPRIHKTTIAKAPLERMKESPKIDSRFKTINTNLDIPPKCIPDFSKQLSRESLIPPIRGDHMKDLMQLDKDFQFANYLRQKYDTNKINIPKGLEIDPKKFPLNGTKMNETRRNVIKNYSVKLMNVERKRKQG